MDIRDRALANSFPVATVPKYGGFEPLGHNGQRILVAGNGEFLEVRRDWLYAVQERAFRVGAVRYPFGDLEPLVGLPIADQIARLLREFVAVARNQLPNECGGAGVYDRATGHCTLKACNSLTASRARLIYAPPALGAAESIAMDIHSHGQSPAFFSATDDEDDIAAVKIAICVGSVDRQVPEVSARLCLSGLFLPMQVHAAPPTLADQALSGMIKP